MKHENRARSLSAMGFDSGVRGVLGYEAGKMSSCENGRLCLALTFRVPSQGTGTVQGLRLTSLAASQKGRKSGKMVERILRPMKAEATRREPGFQDGSGRSQFWSGSHIRGDAEVVYVGVVQAAIRRRGIG